MGKPIVVKGDAVQGTDTHSVTGTGPPPPSLPFAGTGDYSYKGSMTGSLSTFVKIGGKAVALVTSKSSLGATETAPGGGHFPAVGSNLKPTSPVPVPATMQIVPPIVGTGVPNAAAGSVFVTIGGTKVLLGGDKIDTCDGTGSANSTVTASGQSFVSCSA